MYSVVLLMALNACGELPSAESANGCCNCSGGGRCIAVVYETSSGCTGGHGCRGGMIERPGLVRKFFSHQPMIGTCRGGSGCCGGWIVSGGGVVAPVAAPMAVTARPVMQASARLASERIALPEASTSPWSTETNHEGALPVPAVITVTLPADASLTVDGHPTHVGSSRRQFTSPPLRPGTEFTYTFRAQLSRDGEIVSASKRLRVHAGQETQIYLDLPELSVVQR
jgi:uncharacterized protein (TIGR03000 family)